MMLRSSLSIPQVKELGVDPAKVNVNGGSIALGHPIGLKTFLSLNSILTHMMMIRSKWLPGSGHLDPRHASSRTFSRSGESVHRRRDGHRHVPPSLTRARP